MGRIVTLTIFSAVFRARIASKKIDQKRRRVKINTEALKVDVTQQKYAENLEQVLEVQHINEATIER